MNSFNTNAHDFRSMRKCFSVTGCLIFFLLMSHTSCRPSETDDAALYNDGDYTDADDIEWPNFPVVEATTKDHPIIYYKEDIVSEDYDPNKENKSSSTEHETEIKPLSRRKYKDISRRNRLNRTENYRYIKPEKVYFDVYPIEDDGFKEDDAKFNENDIHVEVISLLDDNSINNNNNGEDSESKHSLRKKSRKLSRRHRQRRDVLATDIETDTDADDTTTHALRHKRNSYKKVYPFYRGVPQIFVYRTNPLKETYIKIPIRGIYINAGSPADKPRRPKPVNETPIDFVPRVDGTENPLPPETPPVWDSYDPTTTRRPATTSRPSRRPAPPLIHSGDEDYVPPPSRVNPSQSRTTTRRPPSFSLQELPQEYDEIFPIYTRQPTTPGYWPVLQPKQQRPALPAPTRPPAIRTTTRPPPTTRAPSQTEEPRGLSACVWAISACCTRPGNIRYQCFERLGCNGAFWDFNPCADDIYRRAVEAGNQFLD